MVIEECDVGVGGSAQEPPTGIADRLVAIGEQAKGLLTGDVWRLSDGELEQSMVALHELTAQLAAARGQVLVEARDRGFAVRNGAADLPGWLRERLVLAPGAARRQVELARDTVEGPCQATGAALAAAEISVEHALVICETVRRLPRETSAGQRAAAERYLLEQARVFDPYQLTRLAARLREHLTTVDRSPGGSDPDPERPTGSGGRDDPSARDRAESDRPNGEDAPRSDETTGSTTGADNAVGGRGDHGVNSGVCGDDGRRGDAAGLGGSAQDRLDGGGTGPDPAAVRRFTLTDTPEGTTLIHGELDAEGAALLRTALDGLAAPRPGEDAVPDRRSPARRRADALIELVGRALSANTVPASGGTRPHLTVTIPWATLVGTGAAAASTSWGMPLPRSVLARLTCDAAISRIILDPDGLPLDVGRTARTAPPHVRRAVAARDQGCTFPGCDNPPSWCEVHHVIHWLHDGVTAPHNLVLLCREHHRRVHRDGWEIVFGADQRPSYIPPHRIDPLRRPRRNPYNQFPPDLTDLSDLAV
ncbi:HNH endonuclease signature motif containing protein [Frankia sp. AgKG'84/4]|uniref:HNH endonuclease signature motif containing protein n=1 Tax=Frankia sp. AgKG'84/4 TaxID=573490 RepID=UPI00200DB4C5|nr:HNH endonuclease signature motif containing protein [Frankia sp. AgKG'84/4]MCL9793925.1 HNH endonuclease [Frankia sp. AgKG'84/4]